MEQIYFGPLIAQKRKTLGLTQEALAQKLGVSNQAVSKWEADQCCPDIMLLPALADTFGISIDELFGREPTSAREPLPAPASVARVDGLPWPDDGDLRAVCYVGHRLVDHVEIGKEARPHVSIFGIQGGREQLAQLRFSGSVRDIRSDFGVVVEQGEISGSVYAGDGAEIQGSVGGDVTAGDGVRCGDVSGNVQAGDGVQCGDVLGHVAAGDGVTCGNVAGNVEAGDSVRCGNVEGSISAGDNVSCADVRGEIHADKVVCTSRS